MTNYSRGANFERRVQKFLIGLGWHCTRSAGSHGLFDLIAFKGGEVRLYQVKIDGAITLGEKLVLSEVAKENGFRAYLVKRDGKKIVFEEIY